MSHYTARVEVDGGTLHQSRPLTAPDGVDDLVESVRYALVNSGGQITAVSIEVDTADESQTPIGDSVPASSSEPLPTDADQPADLDVPGTAPAGATA